MTPPEEVPQVTRVTRVTRVAAYALCTDADRLLLCRIVYRMAIEGGELRDESDGSTDTCRWVSRAELAELELVDLAAYGVLLALGDRA
jgi:hypothetical protein